MKWLLKNLLWAFQFNFGYSRICMEYWSSLLSFFFCRLVRRLVGCGCCRCTSADPNDCDPKKKCIKIIYQQILCPFAHCKCRRWAPQHILRFTKRDRQQQNIYTFFFNWFSILSVLNAFKTFSYWKSFCIIYAPVDMHCAQLKFIFARHQHSVMQSVLCIDAFVAFIDLYFISNCTRMMKWRFLF